MSATLALITLPSAAHVLPVSEHTSRALTPINITGPALEEPREFVNLKYLPWPKTPYYVPLRGHVLDQYLAVAVVIKFPTSPPINSLELRRFVLEFANNIKENDPDPGFVPPYATQSTIDVVSNTRWIISLYEGPTLGRLPTVVALAALDELGAQLYSHGPAGIGWVIKDMRRTMYWTYGSFQLEHIQGNILNKSSSNENGEFQTA